MAGAPGASADVAVPSTEGLDAGLPGWAVAVMAVTALGLLASYASLRKDR